MALAVRIGSSVETEEVRPPNGAANYEASDDTMWFARFMIQALSLTQERGAAHIVEHLAFNATEQFENHAIIKFLESIGAEFGACSNAYTTCARCPQSCTQGTSVGWFLPAIANAGGWDAAVATDLQSVPSQHCARRRADETVFELMVPTDEPQFLRDALRIFSQFATSIRCSDSDLAKERGAVLDVRGP